MDWVFIAKRVGALARDERISVAAALSRILDELAPKTAVLKGIDQISDYSTIAPEILKKYIATRDFPAGIVDGEIYALKSDIEEWWRSQLAAQNFNPEEVNDHD